MAPVASKKSPISLLSSWNPTLSYTFLEWVVEEEDNCCAYKAFSNVMRYRKTVDSGSFNFPSSPVFNGFQMLARQFRGSKEIRGIQWKAVKLQTSWDLFIFSIHPSNPIQIPCACHVLIPVETLINKSCGLPGGNARLMRKKKGEGRRVERKGGMNMNTKVLAWIIATITWGWNICYLLDSRNCARHGALFV